MKKIKEIVTLVLVFAFFVLAFHVGMYLHREIHSWNDGDYVDCYKVDEC